MTRINLKVTGARAKASVTGPLTSGMVEIPVTMEYDEPGKDRPKIWYAMQRAILNVGSAAVDARHESSCLFVQHAAGLLS